jgi:acetaldehyde dehydrogenase
MKAVDLTPAKLGPLVVPPVNLTAHLDAPNVNLITCGGQATTPIVHAVSRVCEVPYAEIVSTVASVSAGPGTRQNIDEFTLVTSSALSEVGGAAHGKAIMVLNPADPPILMRNTVFCALGDGYDREAVAASIMSVVDEVSQYVPGYRLKSDRCSTRTCSTPRAATSRPGWCAARGRGRRRLLPALRRQPRHHDRLRRPGRRGHGPPEVMK